MPCARAEQVRAGILPWGGGRLGRVQPIFVWLCFFGAIRPLRVVPQCAALTGRRWCEAPDGRGEAGSQGAARGARANDGVEGARATGGRPAVSSALRLACTKRGGMPVWCMSRGGMPAWSVTVERLPAGGSACAAVEGRPEPHLAGVPATFRRAVALVRCGASVAAHGGLHVLTRRTWSPVCRCFSLL